ncbi:MAG: DUF3883 domain-containing protein [Undibacterium umbellatum]|uniref:DUF3883 domain-containing protein n=1 Tax=Undibacterium umbellatum TaxID=2762300 RepID=UPI003BB5A862
MPRSPFSKKALKAFDLAYDIGHQANAEQVRGLFLNTFPLETLDQLRLKQYVIGTQRPTFCAFVEVKTRAWASIQGATALKFGIYYGRTKKDPQLRYRYQSKLGLNEQQAYRTVKQYLLQLVALGRAKTLQFEAIDAIPLSQMFKAKILSLYFPNRFLNVCSGDHLQLLAKLFDLPDGLPLSEYQHQLLQLKATDPICSHWKNPKYMAFIYHTYINPGQPTPTRIRKPRKKPSRPTNFEEVQAERNRIGKLAEDFALAYEQERLKGDDLAHLVGRIKDRTKYAGDGFDFLSFSTPTQPRYIEVKAVPHERGNKNSRFFLSENELEVSRTSGKKGYYYFYLVRFDGKGHPAECIVEEAENLLRHSVITPAVYRVTFEIVN